MPTTASPKKIDQALQLFRHHGGILRTGEALNLGIHPRTLYGMRDVGLLERLGRGLYRLAALPPLSDPDLVTVALKIPQSVVCLISALHFHQMTTQIPHAVSIAIKRGTEPPRLDYPPIRIYIFSGVAFSEGIETHLIDDTSIRVYSAEKTLADCFKYRNKIGMDTVREAFELYKTRVKRKPRELLRFAKVCRVEKPMRPYLDAVI